MAEWASKKGNLLQFVVAPAYQFESRDFEEDSNYEVAVNVHIFVGSGLSR